MLVLMRSKKGQAISGEYVILITVVLAAIGGMTLYVKRAYQGRIRDAGITMITEVAGRIGNTVVNTVQIEYEPYYAMSQSNREETSYDSVNTGETYRRDFGMAGKSSELSNQLPPKDAH